MSSPTLTDLMRDKDIDPDHIINRLHAMLKEERGLMELKKEIYSPKEKIKAEIQLTNLENLLLTLMMERL